MRHVCVLDDKVPDDIELLEWSPMWQTQIFAMWFHLDSGCVRCTWQFDLVLQYSDTPLEILQWAYVPYVL